MTGVTQKEAAMLYQGVYQPKNRIPIKTDFLDRQGSEEDRIGIHAKDNHRMWIQQKSGSRYTRRTKKNLVEQDFILSKIQSERQEYNRRY